MSLNHDECPSRCTRPWCLSARLLRLACGQLRLLGHRTGAVELISLLSDVVDEGTRSITGPLLAGFGASAVLVGVVSGVREAAALVLRLGSGPLAGRGRRYWGWTIGGYVLTVAAVPLLGLAGALWVACALVITERVGKAVRSPAKDTLLSHATARSGAAAGSPCTRRWTRSAPSPAR